MDLFVYLNCSQNCDRCPGRCRLSANQSTRSRMCKGLQIALMRCSLSAKESTRKLHVNSFANSFANSFDVLQAAVTSEWIAAVFCF